MLDHCFRRALHLELPTCCNVYCGEQLRKVYTRTCIASGSVYPETSSLKTVCGNVACVMKCCKLKYVWLRNSYRENPKASSTVDTLACQSQITSALDPRRGGNGWVNNQHNLAIVRVGLHGNVCILHLIECKHTVNDRLETRRCSLNIEKKTRLDSEQCS